MFQRADQPIVQVDHKLVYESPWLRLYEDAVDRSGTSGIYSVVERADAVTVVLSSSRGQLLMLESFRYPTETVSLEIPMGAVGVEESPEAAAIRELREETGILCSELTGIGWFYALPGLTNQRVHVFAAVVADDVLDSVSTSDSEIDIIGPKLVPIDDLNLLIERDFVTDSLTLCSLFLSSVVPSRNP